MVEEVDGAVEGVLLCFFAWCTGKALLIREH